MKMLRSKAARRLFVALGAVLALMLIGTGPAMASERRSGDTVRIAANEVIADDLYITGNVVVIDGTVEGDVVAAGSQVTINGTIEGDLLAVAQTVVINGTIADDVRVGGAAVQFGPNARVADDALAAGASIEQQAGGSIGGDASLYASQALLAGSIGGRLDGGFEGLELRGAIERDVNVTVGAGGGVMVTPWVQGTGVSIPTVRSGLTVADSARINGELNYTAGRAGDIDTAAKINDVMRIPASIDSQDTAAGIVLSLLRRFAVLFVIGALLLWLLPGWIEGLASMLRARPGASLGWGAIGLVGVIATLILMPIAAILLMILFGQLTLGGLAGITGVASVAAFLSLLTGLMLLVSYVAQIIVGLIIGRYLLATFGSSQLAESRWAPLALGVAIYMLLRAIPYFGVLLAFVVTLLGIGAFVLWLSQRMSLRRMPRTPVAPLQPLPGV